MKRVVPFIILLLVSCGTKKEDVVVTTYSIDVKDYSKPEELFSEFRVLPLETHQEAIISTVEDIKVTDDGYFVLDNVSNSYFRILFFDKKGRYVSKIDKFGRGNGEYQFITNFDIYKSTVFILSSQKILKYSFSGEFLGEIKLDDYYNNFEVIDDKYLYLYAERNNGGEYDFTLFDYEDAKYVNRFDPYSMKGGIGMGLDTFQQTEGDDYLVVKPFDNTVYKLNKEGIAPHISFKFNTAVQFPSNYKDMTYMDLFKELANKDIITDIESIKEERGNTYAVYNNYDPEYGGVGLCVTRITPAGEINTLHTKRDISDKFPMYGNLVGHCDGDIVTVESAFNLINIEKHQKRTFYKDMGVKEGDNPVLLFYKLK